MDWLESQSVSLEETYNWVSLLMLAPAPAPANSFMDPENLPDHLVYALASKGKVKSLGRHLGELSHPRGYSF